MTSKNPTDPNEPHSESDSSSDNSTTNSSTSKHNQESDTSGSVSLEEIPRNSARWKAEKVLETLLELGGESDTTELREHTGLSSDEVKYQYRILGDDLERSLGLVETWMPEEWDGSMPIPPKRVGLTSEGRAELDAGLLDTAPDVEHDSDAQVEQLKARVNSLESQLDEYKGIVENLLGVVGVPEGASPGERSLIEGAVKTRKGTDVFEDILVREGLHPTYDEPQDHEEPKPEDYYEVENESESADGTEE